MEWKQYESKIVNLHQVKLVGWPVKDFNPHILGIKGLDICLAALKGPNTTCYWVKISDRELAERQEELARKHASGEIIVKARKKRSDVGVKRGSRRRGHDDSDKENEGAQRNGKQTCSSSIIDSDEDSE
jgi:hypothetical protein